MKSIPIWDLPLRLFHWSLVALVAGAIITVEMGGNAMDWHARCGFAILALLLFRFLWGFFGGTYARFAHSLPSPRALIASLRILTGRQVDRRKTHHFGHTPAGKWALMLMLGTLWFQAGSGLFANNDDDLKGPLYSLVSRATSDWITGLHKNALIVVASLITLHVIAIIGYRVFRKDDLIGPMIVGHRPTSKDTPEHLASKGGNTIVGLALIAACAGVVWFIVER